MEKLDDTSGQRPPPLCLLEGNSRRSPNVPGAISRSLRKTDVKHTLENHFGFPDSVVFSEAVVFPGHKFTANVTQRKHEISGCLHQLAHNIAVGDWLPMGDRALPLPGCCPYGKRSLVVELPRGGTTSVASSKATESMETAFDPVRLSTVL